MGRRGGAEGEEKHFIDVKNFPLLVSLLHRSAARGTGEQHSCVLIYTHIPTCINFSCVHSVSGSLGATENHPRSITAVVKTNWFFPNLFTKAQARGCPWGHGRKADSIHKKLAGKQQHPANLILSLNTPAPTVVQVSSSISRAPRPVSGNVQCLGRTQAARGLQLAGAEMTKPHAPAMLDLDAGSLTPVLRGKNPPASRSSSHPSCFGGSSGTMT